MFFLFDLLQVFDCIFFSNLHAFLVVMVDWWWRGYLNKPFRPSLPGLLGEVDKSRFLSNSGLKMDRLYTKRCNCMFSLVMHKTIKKILFGKILIFRLKCYLHR